MRSTGYATIIGKNRPKRKCGEPHDTPQCVLCTFHRYYLTLVRAKVVLEKMSAKGLLKIAKAPFFEVDRERLYRDGKKLFFPRLLVRFDVIVTSPYTPSHTGL